MSIEKFSLICERFGLGKIDGAPKSIPGGLLNEIWKITAGEADYAVKIMNVNRSRSKEEYDVIEHYTGLLEKDGVV